MDKQREKLVKLIGEKYNCVDRNRCLNEQADNLLANGVIVPPCKVGDVVYVTDDVFYLDSYEPYKYHYEKEVLEFEIRSISISCNSKGVWTKKIRMCEVKNGKTIDHQHNVDFDEIGKTVFLTKEEALKALGGVQG